MRRNRPGRNGFAKVLRMADKYVDPSGTTDQFQAFVQSGAAEAPARSRTPLIIGGVAALLVIVAIVVIIAVI